MALIQVLNVLVQNNPAPFLSSFQFLITFDCHPPGLREELEWKLIYVGSADDETLDQELDSVLVGPVAVGKNQFLFSAPPPNHSRIPEKDLLDVTVILLTCSYREKEFIRIGYYVNNEYIDEHYQAQLKAAIEANNAAAAAAAAAATQSSSSSSGSASASSPATAAPLPLPPSPIDIRKVARNIAVDRPVITCFNIPWDSQDMKMPELSEEERKKLENERKENEQQAFREAEERATARAKGEMNGSTEHKEAATTVAAEESKEGEEGDEDEEEEDDDDEEEKDADLTADVDLELDEDAAEENGEEEQADEDDGENDMEISVKK